MGARWGILIGSVVASFAAGCGDPPTRQDTAVVASVAVTPVNPTLRRLGDTLRLRAEARDSARIVIARATFAWTSSDTTIARVSTSGLVTAVAWGTATVAAATDGVTGAVLVTVSPSVANVIVAPDTVRFTRLGDTRQLSAVAREADGTVVGGAPISWTSSDTAKVRVSPAGLVTAVAPGSAAVTAASGGVFGTAHVIVAPRSVVRVVVTPANPSMGTLGATLQLTARALDASDSVVPGASFTWASSDTSKVRVSASGMATAVTAGSATVTATTGAVSGSTVVTVAPVAARIVITPANPTLVGIGSTVLLTAEGRDSAGAVFPGLTVTWSSSDTLTARVASNGLVTAVAFGSVVVTARSGTISSGVPVAVVERSLTPPGNRIATGFSHACALTPSGYAYCWGDNSYGQLGDGTTSTRMNPVLVSGGVSFVSIVAGQANTYALDADGAAYVWGRNGPTSSSGQSIPTAALGNLRLRSLFYAYYRLCGLDAGGVAYCWGESISGQPVLGQTFAVLAVGRDHTCGLTATGTAYCWGFNSFGQLGDGGVLSRTTPTAVAGGLTFKAIAAGAYHTCGVAADGAAWCWGSNSNGQLGDETGTSRSNPVRVVGGVAFSTLTAGEAHTCGIAEGGLGWCWGFNASGQAGDRQVGNLPWPVAVAGGQSFASLSAGGHNSCGITTGGEARCWGKNDLGQLGDGGGGIRTTPSPVAGGLTFAYLAPGNGRTTYTCGALSSGAAHCWGSGSYGQLGEGVPWNRAEPSPVSGARVFQSVSTATDHACGVTADGDAWCWGRNQYGQLGDGTTVDRLVPARVAGGLGFSSVAAGNGYTCGLTTTGTAFCWGLNTFGLLGNGTTTPSSMPVAVSGARSYQSITAGNLQTCAIATDGAAYCWGYGLRGQLGNGIASTSYSLVPASVLGGLTFREIRGGDSHTCGLTTAGKAYCWGDNTYGQLGYNDLVVQPTPVPVSGNLTFQTLSVGAEHTCGITTAGAAYCWGRSDQGRKGVGSPVNPVSGMPLPVVGGLTFQAITAGIEHSCGLTTSGAMYCWGANDVGQVGDGEGFRWNPAVVAGGIRFGAPPSGAALRREQAR